MSNNIGHIFLNIAFLLYFILYLPQLFHNAKYQTFAHMSFIMHAMLMQAYSCDLWYALAKHMPWQYLTVSCFGLICLCIQHTQWLLFCFRQKQTRGLIYLIIGCIILLWPILLPCSTNIYTWVARIFFLFHFLPQIIKYHLNPHERDAIDLRYLILSICLSVCDLSSAWCLSWDLPNLWGTFLSLIFKLYLLGQISKNTLSSHPDRTIRAVFFLRG